jgi:hypothetical protein
MIKIWIPDIWNLYELFMFEAESRPTGKPAQAA